MTADEIRHIATAMDNRARQWRTRVIIGAVMAAVFFPLTGAAFALGWFATYGLMQAVEARFRPDGALADRLGARYSLACMALVFFNNVLFGLFGAVEALSSSSIGLTCGALLIGGAVVNAVLVSPGSRPLLLAAVTPQILYLAVLPIGALRNGLSAIHAAQLLFAGILLVLAGLAMWSKLASTLHEMEAAQAQAEDANRAKSQFLATISHEIRTPLNGVLGMAQAMSADELSGRQRERLDVVTQSGQALLTILGDVLDLSKIEAGKLTLEETVFDLDELIDRTQATFHAIAQSKGLAFHVDVAPEVSGSWRGDPTRLRQILGNLISNAVKFTDAGEVRVAAQACDGLLILTVSDTGPGVTPEQLPRLFKKFVQADLSTTRRYGGTGLGLSICGDLAQLMNGTIEARHVTPHGLAFEVRLPLERVAAPAAEVAHADAPDQIDGAALRILAAEDHPVNRQVLTLLLSQAGIIPHIVENGQEAVEAWRTGEWDVILMDVQMPVMDGPTAARLIRAEEKAAGKTETPIIALTANVMTHQIEEYRQAGMAQSVAKPIQVEALLTAIELALKDDARQRSAAA